ncbi:MAG: 50S ribosomal protein L23 [Anaerolineae bacterium]|nr:50S ribosomal protein L23 [Anaerolineae bacterium]
MNPYQVLVRPILTEKSGYQADVLSKYTFEVDLRANRLDVKRAVEQVFDVSVTKVNVMIVPGKSRRWGRHLGVTSSWKKAVVTLASGDSIQFFEGV